MSPVRWGPLGTGHKVIQPPDDDKKMSVITPEHISETIASMMSDSEVNQ